MKRKIIIIISTLIVVVVVFSIWYHIPIRLERVMQICSVEPPSEKPETIIIDIRLYRCFFKPSVIKGNIIFREKTYETYKDTKYSYGNFLEALKMKFSLKDDAFFIPFYNAELTGSDYFEDKILLVRCEDKLDTLALAISIPGKVGTEEDSGELLAGPAENSIQADDVFQTLMH